MSSLDGAPEIVELANRLGIGGNAPVNGILAYCYRQVDGWVAQAGGVTDIDALEALVTSKLQMVFEEIRSDADWDRLTEVYARGKKEYVFAGMRSKFDDEGNPTYGALVQRRNAGSDDSDRFVAVIDCRGSKLSRRFFTRWHEIAHRLTTHTDLLLPAYRSEQDPIERMMDEIAGHIGFYEPLFGPAFTQARQDEPLLSFDAVQRLMEAAFPAASFQATLFACSRRLQTPLLYIEAALAHKRQVRRSMATLRLFGDAPPPGELRVVKVVPNEAARQVKFYIPPNMRVPAGSLIGRLFGAELLESGFEEECLGQWESQGRALPSQAVMVEGRKVGDRVIAIIQPVEARLEGQQICGSSMFSASSTAQAVAPEFWSK